MWFALWTCHFSLLHSIRLYIETYLELTGKPTTENHLIWALKSNGVWHSLPSKRLSLPWCWRNLRCAGRTVWIRVPVEKWFWICKSSRWKRSNSNNSPTPSVCSPQKTSENRVIWYNILRIYIYIYNIYSRTDHGRLKLDMEIGCIQRWQFCGYIHSPHLQRRRFPLI